MDPHDAPAPPLVEPGFHTVDLRSCHGDSLREGAVRRCPPISQPQANRFPPAFAPPSLVGTCRDLDSLTAGARQWRRPGADARRQHDHRPQDEPRPPVHVGQLARGRSVAPTARHAAVVSRFRPRNPRFTGCGSL